MVVARWAKAVAVPIRSRHGKAFFTKTTQIREQAMTKEQEPATQARQSLKKSAMKTATATLAACAIAAFTLPAAADEQMQLLASSGRWIAAAHSPSMTAAPDVCLVVTTLPTEERFLIRADVDSTEVRLIDEDWSLPAGVTGSLKIDVGAYHHEFNISGNTSAFVSAAAEQDELLLLFAAMDNAGSMSVTAGTAKPLIVSLAGSTKATNAFRTCAGIRSSGSGGGSNPFSGGSSGGNPAK
jgi:hypothetical protein